MEPRQLGENIVYDTAVTSTSAESKTRPLHRPLEGLRILECSSFVAGPSGCMTLGMLGADVIRVVPIGGAGDFGRWPVSRRTGESLYWSALNSGKKSLCVDLRAPEGRELVVALATLPGPESGIVVDKTVGRGLRTTRW
jgi:2-methylfumaryl-CoA isomerase